MKINAILEHAVAGNRLEPADALALLQSEDWPAIVSAGHERRNRMHDPAIVSYTGFRVINYTNFCDVNCNFCGFRDEIDSDRGYTLTLDQIAAKAVETLALGVDQVFFQGGVNPRLPLSYYLDAFRMLRDRYHVTIRALSPMELKRLSETAALPLPELLRTLKASGVESVPGAGAEILTGRMREVLSPKKLSASEWCEVMGECHRAGLPGSCNIVFGSVETTEDIVEHLRLLRDQQDKTGGFFSFVPWVFQPQTKRFPIRHVTGREYLRLLAVSRLFLDNIPNIEVSIMVMGRELAELALTSGANDINSIVIEENVLLSSGLKTMRGAESFIREAGFTPARRTMNYEFGRYSK